MPKLQEVKGCYTLALPREYVQRLGWRKGDVLCVSFSPAGGLELVSATPKK